MKAEVGPVLNANLTSLGEKKLRNQRSQVDHGLSEVYTGTPTASLPSVQKSRRELEVSCFDWIGALRVALSRLRTPVYCCVVIEVARWVGR